jgi:RHS repeat-associated protein
MEDQQDASGLLYRRNRYYDPSTGRFTQEDPIGLAGGINLYGFANGDPVTYSDPYGLDAEETYIQGGGAVIRAVFRGISSALARRAARAATRRAARQVDELLDAAKASGRGVQRLDRPSTPNDMSNTSFGTRVMEWGRGNNDARERIGSLTKEQLENRGVTREMAQQWRDFYVNEVLRIPNNPSARGRAELMQRAVELLQ